MNNVETHQEFIKAIRRGTGNGLLMFTAILSSFFIMNHLFRISSSFLISTEIANLLRDFLVGSNYAVLKIKTFWLAINYIHITFYLIDFTYCLIIGMFAILFHLFNYYFLAYFKAWVFKFPLSRTLYFRIGGEQKIQSRTYRNLLIFIIPFVVILTFLALENVSIDLLFIIVVVCITISIIYVFLYFLKQIQKDKSQLDLDEGFIQKYIFNFVIVYLGFLILFAFNYKIWIPYVSAFITKFHDGYIWPYYLSFLENIKNSAILLPSNENLMDTINWAIEFKIIPFHIPFSDFYIDGIVFLFVVFLLLLLIVPYLILGGYGKGIFYISLVGIAFLIDYIIQNKVVFTFRLNPNSSIVLIFTALLIFGNALMFDLFYEIIIARKDKFCRGCNKTINEKDSYCSNCGLIQE